jgi:hypothetical protein
MSRIYLATPRNCNFLHLEVNLNLWIAGKTALPKEIGQHWGGFWGIKN